MVTPEDPRLALVQKLNKVAVALALEAQKAIAGGLSAFQQLPKSEEILSIVRANAWAGAVALEINTGKIDRETFYEQLKVVLGEAKS